MKVWCSTKSCRRSISFQQLAKEAFDEYFGVGAWESTRHGLYSGHEKDLCQSFVIPVASKAQCPELQTSKCQQVDELKRALEMLKVVEEGDQDREELYKSQEESSVVYATLMSAVREPRRAT